VALYRPLWEEYDRKRAAERIAAVQAAQTEQEGAD